MCLTLCGKSQQRCSPTRLPRVPIFALLAFWLAVFLGLPAAYAQTSVTTHHNDISRTGANTHETILTPTNVNINSFGKLFSYPVDGWVYAQPLYVAGVTLGTGTAQAGTTHNVAFVATEHDTVYAFDADSDVGANGNPLWSVSLIGAGEKTVPNNDLSCGDLFPEIGITATPFIDLTTNTLYVVAKTTVNDTTFIQRLHALDITTGQEKFGGPVALSGSVSGNGSGSSGGVLNWDPKWQHSRASLLLVNGIVYVTTGSHCDNGPWHGWILAYNATTLNRTGVWCSSPNSLGSGLWGGGSSPAADVPAGKPYGRIFVGTGNGTYDAVAPNYTNSADYGDSILKLDLNNGVPTMNSNGTVVGDAFTPHNQANLNNADEDQGSGGTVLLPAPSLVQVGKSGIIYLLNRENLGGYNPNNTTDPGEAAKVGGVWGAPAYWNGNVYVWGQGDFLKAFSFANGVLSANPTSTSSQGAAPNGGTYSPTPSVSANGTTNGIVWSLVTDNAQTQGRAILYAHDATNVAKLLYSSGSVGNESNFTRDNPGNSVKFIVPTVTNGKVYVGSESQFSVFGLLGGATQAATPAISPASKSFNPSIQVTITDSTSGASIYYTTDGTTPTTASTKYSAPFTLTTTSTVNAIAAGTGLLQSPEASATYTLTTQATMPVFNPSPGSYGSVQSVAISTATPNATIYYTTDGTKPTTASAKYTGPVSVGTTETLSAIAVASGLSNSPVASGLYTIALGGVTSISFANGFAAGGMNLLGSAKLNGSSLELTDGAGGEAAAAWYQVEANIDSFVTDFTFQVTPGTNPTADGFTFTMQGNNSTALGLSGSGLGFAGIPSSVAVKFDLYSNDGEGFDSTGLYLNGASPTSPAVDMSSSGVDLHSGHPFHAHLTYDGTTLKLTLTDTTTNAAFSTSWPVDIPTTVGDDVAFIGFTAATGGNTAIQNIQTWTYASGSSGTPTASTPTFSPAAGTYATAQTVTISDSTSGATIYYTTNGTTPTTSSTQYTAPINVSSTQTVQAIAAATGFTQSAVGSAAYTITTGTTVISLGNGFTAGAMALNGSAKLNGTRLRLTDGGTSEAAGAWYNSTVNIQQFTTNFSFQITGGTAPPADGFAFVIQGGSSTAIGSSGGSLGYGSTNGSGIPNSIAVKFDLYSNNGEGADSTGLYVNGAAPMTPAIDMTSSGVNLHSTDVFNVQMSYDGTNLTMSITDATTNATFTHTWPINIPGTVGANAAYVGFTGGTGGYTAIQEIIGWTMTSSAAGTAAATPTFSPVAGTYTTTQTVTISDTSSSATIYYTTNGTTPTTSSTKYTAPITVSSTQTVQAIAVATGFTQSAMGSATYTITQAAATPTFSPVAGTYTTTQTVTISDTSSGATIYYTTNGTTPTTSSTKYTAPITVSSTQTVQAIAVATGFTQSAVGSATYTITQAAATPTFSPVAGTYTTTQTVTISDTSSGATIYYTTNGTTPTTSSTKYTAPITVSSTQTVQAIAVATGFTQSAVGSATYTITQAAATPTFSPVAGTYTTTQTVTISDTSSGATIYYTTNGTTPTTSSTKYTAPITVSSTQTLKAIATATGFTQSAVGTAAYTISSGSNVISLGNGFTAGAMVLNGKSTLNGTRLRLTDGTTGDAASAWYNSPVNIQQFTANFSFQVTGGTNPTADGFTFAIQGGSSSAIGPSGAGLGYGGSGGIPNSLAVKFDLYNNNGEGFDSTGLYVNGVVPTTPAVDMTSSGVNLHSTDIFNVQMSYDGTNLTMTITDATSNATFTKTWPLNIPATVGANTAFVGFTGGTGGNTAIQEIINLTMTSTTAPIAATPTFSPAAGTYATTQTVTISDATSGSSIYYTTNGATPTTSSTKYTAPITVSNSQIVQAIAVATGFSQSAVASSSYTITTGTTTINLGGGFTAGAMILNGKSTLNGTRLRLTDGGTGEAASAWYSSPVNIQQFTTKFSFQISGGTNPPADGFAFVIQGGPSTAIGPSGQGLGYGGTGGITSSIALKFDLYSNNGEGSDSTGLYLNGAVPTTPAVDMTSSGLDLHTGDVFNVQMTYDGTNLTMTITDAATNATFTHAWPINIPATVGGNTAYAGFTGGTGGYTAIQEIINWTM
jgi:hypothetical protein